MNSIADLIEEIEEGEIVQIDPTYGPDQMGGMFMVITEVHEWGLYGYIANWAVGSYGPMFIRVPLTRVRRTGGRVQWPLAPMLCESCGKNPADLPGRLCVGCEAYREHQQ